MDARLASLRSDVEFALERIAPHLREAWTCDVHARFSGWRSLPDFPLEQGLRKLISDFYVRALNPVSSREDFYAARNVVLDYLDATFREIDDLRSVSDEQWRIFAKVLPSLFESPHADR